MIARYCKVALNVQTCADWGYIWLHGATLLPRMLESIEIYSSVAGHNHTIPCKHMQAPISENPESSGCIQIFLNRAVHCCAMMINDVSRYRVQIEMLV